MISNRKLILPYAAPYLAYVIVASVFSSILPIEINYLLRIIAVIGLLIWAWKWYMVLTGPKSPWVSAFTGIIAGFLGALVWILLLTPFVDKSVADPWSTPAFLLRLFSAGLLVPVFEEILMRGYIFRLAYQWEQERKRGNDQPLPTALDEKSVLEVSPGAWSWAAIIISTLVFASGHQISEWPASIAYGLLMSMLWITRKDLLSCIVAHSITNIVLALYVLKSGNWYLW